MLIVVYLKQQLSTAFNMQFKYKQKYINAIFSFFERFSKIEEYANIQVY